MPCTSVAASLLLLLAFPGVSLAQQRAEARFHAEGTSSVPVTVAPRLPFLAYGPIVSASEDRAASTASPTSSDRLSRSLIGLGAGLLVGATAGTVYGYTRYDDSQTDPLLSRGTEATLFGIMSGSAGAVIGAAVGFFWPDRQVPPASVSLAPASHGDAVVSLMVRV